MKISVIGIGGVGYSMTNILAAAGFNAIGVDIDPKVLESPSADASVIRFIKRYKSKIKENLILTTDYSQITGSEFAIVVVNTDFDEKQQQLTTYILEKALKMLGEHVQTTVIVMSTLPYGASSRLKSICDAAGLDYCYSPIMVNQGNYVDSFFKAPFLILGANDDVGQKVMMFYAQLFQIFRETFPPTYIVSPLTAELTKLIANAFLSTKLSYANYVGGLCEKVSKIEGQPVDANLILHIIGNDPRIGSRFLKAGFAFGGGCLPRDLKSLITSCQQIGSHPEILTAVDRVNAERTRVPIKVLEMYLDQPRAITVLGTAYKAGIDDERGSKSVELIEFLKELGHTVSSYDPNVPQTKSLSDILKNTEIVIVTTDEREFSNIGKMLSKKCQVVCDFTITPIVDGNLLPSHVNLFTAGVGWKRSEK